MKFNKQKFINNYGEQAFALLINFLSDEAHLLEYSDFEFIMLENFRSFEYEGNRYWILKNIEKIEVIDGLQEKHGYQNNFYKISLNPQEFLEIIKEANEILAQNK